MQKDGSHDAGPSGLPDSPSNHASSDGFQLSANMTNRLRNLVKWRIDHSSIEFPQEAREVLGGHATVSRAVLASPSGGKDNTDQPDPTRDKVLDSGEPAGETSPRRKDVAVKKMKMSSDMARVLGLTVREAEFLVGLSHENIIELEGFIKDLSKDIIWLVFPWEENGTLRDFVASADWEIPERIHLIRDVASGVEYLHSRRPPILHGDLKSINVLVNSECRAVITDFGSARHLKTEDLNKATERAQNKLPAALLLEATFCASTNTITLTGDHYTLRWAAPELLYEEEPSLCSDMWALGWVAYEVMTNCIPFQDVKDTVVIKCVIQGDLPSIAGDTRMSPIQALCSMMLVCWSIEPSKRPTAEDFRKSINWMPAIIPNRARNSDTGVSQAHSPELLIQLGDMHRRQGDYLNALDCFTKALGGYTDAGNIEGKVTALVQLGQVHRLRNESDQAISSYSEALHTCTDIGNRQGRASALWGLASVHRARSEYSQAITLYSEALKIRTDMGDRQGRASALKGLADVHRARNEYSQAIAFYSEDLQIRTDLGDRRGRASAIWGLAEVHRARSEYSQAIAFYSEALEIHADLGDRHGRADALFGLATVHLLRSEYSQAITFYSEDLQIYTDLGDRRGRGSALLGLAEVHRLRSEYSQAITFYSEALQISTDLGNRPGKADALKGLADVHMARNEYSQAITFYSEDLQIRTETGDRLGKAQTLRGLAEVHRLQNEFNQAITLLSEALQICTDIGNRFGRAFALLGLADVHRDQEDHGNVIRLYTEAAEAFEEIGNIQAATYASNQAAKVRRLSPKETLRDAQ